MRRVKYIVPWYHGFVFFLEARSFISLRTSHVMSHDIHASKNYMQQHPVTWCARIPTISQTLTTALEIKWGSKERWRVEVEVLPKASTVKSTKAIRDTKVTKPALRGLRALLASKGNTHPVRGCCRGLRTDERIPLGALSLPDNRWMLIVSQGEGPRMLPLQILREQREAATMRVTCNQIRRPRPVVLCDEGNPAERDERART